MEVILVVGIVLAVWALAADSRRNAREAEEEERWRIPE